jgi:hypothetical protein
LSQVVLVVVVAQQLISLVAVWLVHNNSLRFRLVRPEVVSVLTDIGCLLVQAEDIPPIRAVVLAVVLIILVSAERAVMEALALAVVGAVLAQQVVRAVLVEMVT